MAKIIRRNGVTIYQTTRSGLTNSGGTWKETHNEIVVSPRLRRQPRALARSLEILDNELAEIESDIRAIENRPPVSRVDDGDNGKRPIDGGPPVPPLPTPGGPSPLPRPE